MLKRIFRFVVGVLQNATWDWFKIAWEQWPLGWSAVMISILAPIIDRIFLYLHGIDLSQGWQSTLLWFCIALLLVILLRNAGPFTRHRARYDKVHNLRTHFELYEAACLWKGEEPNPEFPTSRPVNAVFALLQETIIGMGEKFRYGEDGEYNSLTEHLEQHKSMRNFNISRWRLEDIAAHLGDRPEFLFGRAVRKIQKLQKEER
jgi:hypothetical protein